MKVLTLVFTFSLITTSAFAKKFICHDKAENVVIVFSKLAVPANHNTFKGSLKTEVKFYNATTEKMIGKKDCRFDVDNSLTDAPSGVYTIYCIESNDRRIYTEYWASGDVTQKVYVNLIKQKSRRTPLDCVLDD